MSICKKEIIWLNGNQSRLNCKHIQRHFHKHFYRFFHPPHLSDSLNVSLQQINWTFVLFFDISDFSTFFISLFIFPLPLPPVRLLLFHYKIKIHMKKYTEKGKSVANERLQSGGKKERLNWLLKLKWVGGVEREVLLLESVAHAMSNECATVCHSLKPRLGCFPTYSLCISA